MATHSLPTRSAPLRSPGFLLLWSALAPAPGPGPGPASASASAFAAAAAGHKQTLL